MCGCFPYIIRARVDLPYLSGRLLRFTEGVHCFVQRAPLLTGAKL